MEATNPQGEVQATNQPVEVRSIEERLLDVLEPPAEETPVETQDVQPEKSSEEPTEGQPEADQPEDELVEIEIDGETWQVPPKLKEGVMFEKDYRRKTQELAAERQTVQEQRQAIEAERQAFQNQVQAQQQHFQLYAQVAGIDQQIAQFANVDFEQLLENDPVQAVKLDRSLRDLKEARNNLVQQAIQHQQQLSYMQQQQMVEMVEKGKAELPKRIPDWNPDKAKALRDYGVNLGFTPEEMSQVIDPRHVEVLNKAFLYDQLMASKPEVNKKVSNAPKMVKSQAQQPKQNTKDVLRKIVKTSTDKNTKNAALQRLLEAKLS